MLNMPNTPEHTASGQHVLEMPDAQFEQFAHRTAQLDAIDNAWGYQGQADSRATPEERAAIAARLLIKNIQGE